MADTTTTNLLLTKPEVGASTDTWGTKINTDLDSVDAVFAAAGTGTSVGLNVGSGKTLKVAGTTDFSANLTFTGTGNRITGDFSNATIANRVAFQTSTTNGNTFVNAIPNGTGTSSGFATYNNSDTANASFFTHQVVGTTEARINSTLAGTGTYLPMTFYTGGSESLRLSATSKAVILAGGNTSATGTGIAFPATQSASTDANTLDDYEEGTWTPVFSAGGITGTSITYSGTYTKIGRVVTVNFYAYSASGNINVSSYVVFSGVPFSASNLGSGAVTTEDIDIFASLGFANAAGTSFGLSKCGNGTSSNLYATVTIFV